MSIWNGTMTLTLGEGTDDDTLQLLFGRWAEKGYIVTVNDHCIEVTDVAEASDPEGDGDWAIVGRRVGYGGRHGEEVRIPWNQVRSILVH